MKTKTCTYYLSRERLKSLFMFCVLFSRLNRSEFSVKFHVETDLIIERRKNVLNPYVTGENKNGYISCQMYLIKPRVETAQRTSATSKLFGSSERSGTYFLNYHWWNTFKILQFLQNTSLILKKIVRRIDHVIMSTVLYSV